MIILDVQNLSVSFDTPDGSVYAVNDVSFTLHKGKCLGVVGESGSGKSQLFRAILGGLADNGEAQGKALFGDTDLLTLPLPDLNKIRGNEIALVAQNTVSGLTPHVRVGNQLTEILKIHKGMSEADARNHVIDVMERVRIPEAKKRLKMYPHEFSGGMRQRVTIAAALLCKPALLIADEPTTALDVTVQAQILDIFDDLQNELEMAVIFITHDLSLLAGRADDIMVMYGGRVFEKARVDDFYKSPLHPYSRELLASVPQLSTDINKSLATIPGQPSDLRDIPTGCCFYPRCVDAHDNCLQSIPAMERKPDNRKVACYIGEKV